MSALLHKSVAALLRCYHSGAVMVAHAKYADRETAMLKDEEDGKAMMAAAEAEITRRIEGSRT